MAVTELTSYRKSGSRVGYTDNNSFHVVFCIGYERYNFGYKIYTRSYVFCDAANQTFTSTLTTSWTGTERHTIGTSSDGKIVGSTDSGWVLKGSYTCGTKVSFDGISAQYSGNNTYKSSTSEFTYTVPKAQHTLEYNSNGGSNAPASQTKTYGTDLAISSIILTKTGYEHIGWSTSADAEIPEYLHGESYTHDQWGGTVTLYAVWEKRLNGKIKINGSVKTVTKGGVYKNGEWKELLAHGTFIGGSWKEG